MNPARLFSSLFLSACLAVLLTFAARADDRRSTVAFSRPDQPGTIKIQVARGTLEIQGADSAEVVVVSNQAPKSQAPRQDGLRVLSAASSFSLSEKDNVITLDALESGAGSAATFRLTVPRQSSIVVQNSWGGDIRCAGITGNIEITGTNGSIRLEDVAGGVVVTTMNGEIHATMKELQAGKPLSFQSMNGEIVLRLPADTQANVRIRTQNGSVLTDFDEQALVTKTESSGRHFVSHAPFAPDGQNILTPAARDAIREAARVGAEAVREAAVAIKEAAEAAREGAHASRMAPTPPAAPRAPRAPKPMIMPTLTGGKLVTGTLNGGGTEINIATMNGDVTLRRAAGKP
jgi:hypothetical protein